MLKNSVNQGVFVKAKKPLMKECLLKKQQMKECLLIQRKKERKNKVKSPIKEKRKE